MLVRAGLKFLERRRVFTGFTNSHFKPTNKLATAAENSIKGKNKTNLVTDST